MPAYVACLAAFHRKEQLEGVAAAEIAREYFLLDKIFMLPVGI